MLTGDTNVSSLKKRFKVIYQVAATPLTYTVVGYLKRHEGLDPSDYRTNFCPIALHGAGACVSGCTAWTPCYGMGK